MVVLGGLMFLMSEVPLKGVGCRWRGEGGGGGRAGPPLGIDVSWARLE